MKGAPGQQSRNGQATSRESVQSVTTGREDRSGVARKGAQESSGLGRHHGGHGHRRRTGLALGATPGTLAGRGIARQEGLDAEGFGRRRRRRVRHGHGHVLAWTARDSGGGAPFSGLLLEDAFPGPSGEWRYPRIRRRLRTADVVPAVEDASEEEEEVFFSEGRC